MNGNTPEPCGPIESTTTNGDTDEFPLPSQVAMESGASLVQIHPVVGRCGVQHLGTSTIIGRDKRADCFIQLDSVSRQHAKIERLESGVFRIIDLESTNGTYVNDVQIREWELGPNDVIRCGGAILKVLPADDLEAQYHEVSYMMMTHDSMTGVFNRQYFDDMLKREVAAAGRYEKTLSVLILDLDHFKAINDLHGHLAGDDVLREFSRRVTTTMRTESVFARLGGEEFGILLLEADAAEAKIVAERVRMAVSSRKFTLANAQVPISVSIGIATTSGSPPVTASELMQEADSNLYEAKRTGRDRVCSTFETRAVVE
ncbi:MAG: GGDEF domain-containing protein [Planctomycetaceae bacterium]